MHAERKAQLSLEFLLVMAAFVLALSVFIPLAVKTTKTALFALEAQRAKSFISDYSDAAFHADIYADGTVKKIKSNAVHEWFFKAENGTAELTISSESLGKTISVDSEIPLSVSSAEFSLNGSFILQLKKQNSQISTELISAN